MPFRKTYTLIKDIKGFHKQASSTLLAHAERSLDFDNSIEQLAQLAALEQDVTLRDNAELRKMLEDVVNRDLPPEKKVEAPVNIGIAEEANGEKEVQGFDGLGEGVVGETRGAGFSCVSDVELPESQTDAMDEDKSMSDLEGLDSRL